MHRYDSGVDGPTTVVVGGIHGDESAGYLAADAIANWSVTTGELVVLPRANVEAIAADERPYDDDLNRQFPPTGGACDTALADAVWGVVERHDPDWVFDLHSSRGIYESGDGGVGQALFPTWRYPARHYGEAAVEHLNHEFDLSGDLAYRMGNTLDADRKMLAHRVAGVLNRPGYICETTEKAPRSEQVAWHLFTVEWVMSRYDHLRGTPTSESSSSPVPFQAEMLSLDERAETVAFDGRYGNPVVVAPSLSADGSDPVHPRLGGLTNTSVDARVEAWPYLGEVGASERAGALVFEEDTSVRGDGGDRVAASRRHVGNAWESISFEDAFDAPPAVLASPQSDYHGIPLVARVRNVTETGFDLRVQEEDAGSEFDDEEMTGWVAFERGPGALDGRRYEAGTVPMDEHERSISFDGSYEDPVFLASPNTYAGWNTVTVRHRDLRSDGVTAFLHEEQSADWEQGHVNETVGYVVFER